MFPMTRLIAAPAFAFALALSLPTATIASPLIESSVAADSVSESKQTIPALYVTAAEAAEVLATRDDILLIDVRTPEETMLVGYPDAADVNIPFLLLDPDHKLNEKGSYVMAPNPRFADAVLTYLDGRAPAAILVMCRSGGRSAKAVDALVATGLDVPLYSVLDGFEGDKDAEGRRSVNGWKNNGAPWGTKIAAGFLQGVD